MSNQTNLHIIVKWQQQIHSGIGTIWLAMVTLVHHLQN